MALFQGVEIWSDVECNAGILLAAFTFGANGGLIAAQESRSLEGEERASFSVYRDDLRATETIPGINAPNISRGHVARFKSIGSDNFTEWRIADLLDGGTGEEAVLVVTCLSIATDLSRAIYRTADGDGNPVFAYDMEDATVEDVLDGPVRDALDTAGLAYIVTGTVEPTETFDQSGEYETAQQIVKGTQDPARAPSEFQLRRVGTTEYAMDLLDAIGSSAPQLDIIAGRNLLNFRRQRLFADSATRIIPRGQSDQTERSVGYAYWPISAKNTSGDHYIDVDVPTVVDNQLNGMYAAEIGVAFMSHEITESIRLNATTTRLMIADVSAYTAGRPIEFRTASGATAPRLCVLDHPAAQAQYGGIFEKFFDSDKLSGAINYAVNPIFAAWANPSNPPDDYTIVQTSGTVTGSQETSVVKFGAYSYKASAGAPGAGAIRSPAQRVYDDSPYAYHVWAWVRYTHASYPPTVSVVRADTHVVHGHTLTLNSTDHPIDTWILVAFEVDDVAAAAGGFKVEVSFSAGAATDYYLGAVGIQPFAWSRKDVYHPAACDLWRAGITRLADAIAPVQYDGVLADREQIDVAYADEALVIGQTVVVTDPAVSATPITLRLLEYTRDHRTKQTTVRFGRTRTSLAEMLAQRQRVAGKVPEVEFRQFLLDAGAQFVAAADAVEAGTVTDVQDESIGATTSEALRQFGRILKGYKAA